jgi:hypothetical protein
LATCGPIKAATTPPAITAEIAWARKAGLAASAAASRKYQKNPACTPCSSDAAHNSAKLWT